MDLVVANIPIVDSRVSLKYQNVSTHERNRRLTLYQWAALGQKNNEVTRNSETKRESMKGRTFNGGTGDHRRSCCLRASRYNKAEHCTWKEREHNKIRRVKGPAEAIVSVLALRIAPFDHKLDRLSCCCAAVLSDGMRSGLTASVAESDGIR